MSIVTEVLSSAGKLQKEDLNDKITSLSQKVSQLKVEVWLQLSDKKEEFLPSYNDTTILSTEINTTLSDVKNLNNLIQHDMHQSLIGCKNEVVGLQRSIEEMQLTAEALTTLLTLHQLLETSNTAEINEDYHAAAISLSSAESKLSNSHILSSSNVDVVQSLLTEFVVRKERLLHTLTEAWNSNIILTDHSKQQQCVKLCIKSSCDYSSLLSALQYCSALQAQLTKLGRRVLQLMLVPVMQHETSITVHSNEDNDDIILALHINSQEDTLPQVSDCFNNLTAIVKFLQDELLHVRVGGDTSVMRLLGECIGGELCDALIREVLAPNIPSTPHDLPQYDTVQEKADALQAYLINIGFLSEKSRPLVEYASNINVHFANKMCSELLCKARSIIQQDLHYSKQLEGPRDPRDELKLKLDVPDATTHDDGGLKASKIISKNTFQFPKCQISDSCEEILSLMKSMLATACTSEPLLAMRLYCITRNIVTLYCDVTPVYHKKSLNTLPHQAALCHNNCMYLAHMLLTLPQEYKSGFPHDVMTYMDLVHELRTVASTVFTNQMRVQRDQIMDILKHTGSFASIASDASLFPVGEKCVKQCLHQLQHLQRVWADVLPASVYCRAIGTLLNSGIEEIISQILNLEDIPADATGHMISILNTIIQQGPKLFQFEGCGAGVYCERLVSSWLRLEELLLVLGYSLVELEERWSSGKGKLAIAFTIEETKHLIRALFQNTDRRARTLARIRIS